MWLSSVKTAPLAASQIQPTARAACRAPLVAIKARTGKQLAYDVRVASWLRSLVYLPALSAIKASFLMHSKLRVDPVCQALFNRTRLRISARTAQRAISRSHRAVVCVWLARLAHGQHLVIRNARCVNLEVINSCPGKVSARNVQSARLQLQMALNIALFAKRVHFHLHRLALVSCVLLAKYLASNRISASAASLVHLQHNMARNSACCAQAVMHNRCTISHRAPLASLAHFLQLAQPRALLALHRHSRSRTLLVLAVSARMASRSRFLVEQRVLRAILGLMETL